MARNGTWLVALFAVTAVAGADEELVERWDKPHVESFAMKDATPQDVLKEIRTRFDVPVEYLELDLPHMDFEAKDVTFFEAIDRLASSQDLLVAGWPLGRQKNRLLLVRTTRPLPATPVAHVGPTRLSVQRICAINVTEWIPEDPRQQAMDETIDKLIPGMRAYLHPDEPRLRMTFCWIAQPGCEQAALVGWEVRHAESDTGAAIDVTAPPELPLRANGTFSVDFAAVPRRVRSIAKLEGRIRVVLPLREGEVEFLATEQGRTKALGEASVRLDDVDDLQAVVRFTVNGAPCKPLNVRNSESAVRVGSTTDTEGSAPFLTVLAYREDGREIAGSLRRTWSDVGSPRKTFWIDLDEAPARLLLRTTTGVVEREMPFAFKDIPLPE